MSPLTNLRIDAALSGREDAFAEALAAREHREQHWSGAGGKGGDVRPSSRLTLHELMMERGGDVCDRLMSEKGWSEADFRYAAGRLEAMDDPDLRVLAQHMRAFEMFASEESQKEMTRSMNAMTEALIAGQSEEYLMEQRTAIGNKDSKRQHPAQRAPLMYPVGVTPTAEDDPDRAARGAMQPAMSQALRNLAREVAGLAKLSSNVRQRNRLLQRAAELERMSVRQYEREGASEVVPSDDPSEFNNVVNGAARNLDAEARAAGAQDGDSLDSYDDWPKSDAQSDDAIQDQADTARDAALQLDEDIPTMPRVPRAGRRVDEDQLGDPSLHADEPEGLRRNKFDDFRGHVRRGRIPSGSGKPRIGDRFGGERSTYSAFGGKESLREAELTEALLFDLDCWDRAGHSWF